MTHVSSHQGIEQTWFADIRPTEKRNLWDSARVNGSKFGGRIKEDGRVRKEETLSLMKLSRGRKRGLPTMWEGRFWNTCRSFRDFRGGGGRAQWGTKMLILCRRTLCRMLAVSLYSLTYFWSKNISTDSGLKKPRVQRVHELSAMQCAEDWKDKEIWTWDMTSHVHIQVPYCKICITCLVYRCPVSKMQPAPFTICSSTNQENVRWSRIQFISDRCIAPSWESFLTDLSLILPQSNNAYVELSVRSPKEPLEFKAKRRGNIFAISGHKGCMLPC